MLSVLFLFPHFSLTWAYPTGWWISINLSPLFQKPLDSGRPQTSGRLKRVTFALSPSLPLPLSHSLSSCPLSFTISFPLSLSPSLYFSLSLPLSSLSRSLPLLFPFSPFSKDKHWTLQSDCLVLRRISMLGSVPYMRPLASWASS